MLVQLVELPGMEVDDKVAVVPQRAATEPAIEAEGEVVAGEPEEREAQKRRHRGGDLHHALLHEVGAWGGEVHVAPWDEGRMQRAIVAVARTCYLGLGHRHHTSLPIAADRSPRELLEGVLRLLQVAKLEGPVVVAVGGQLVPLV